MKEKPSDQRRKHHTDNRRLGLLTDLHNMLDKMKVESKVNTGTQGRHQHVSHDELTEFHFP